MRFKGNYCCDINAFLGFILHWYLLTMNIAQGPDKNFNFCLANVGDVYNLETIWRQFGDKIS